MDFFDLNNPFSYLSYLDAIEPPDQAVQDFMDYVHAHYEEPVDVEDIDYALNLFDINYAALPTRLKDYIDTIDVC